MTATPARYARQIGLLIDRGVAEGSDLAKANAQAFVRPPGIVVHVRLALNSDIDRLGSQLAGGESTKSLVATMQVLQRKWSSEGEQVAS